MPSDAADPALVVDRFGRLMDVVSLADRTDLALLQLGGSEVSDRGDHLVVRTPHNPAYWWGNFLLMAEPPAPGARGSPGLAGPVRGGVPRGRPCRPGLRQSRRDGRRSGRLRRARPDLRGLDRHDGIGRPRAAAAQPRRRSIARCRPSRTGRRASTCRSSPGMSPKSRTRRRTGVRRPQGGDHPWAGRGRPRRLVRCLPRGSAGRPDGAVRREPGVGAVPVGGDPPGVPRSRAGRHVGAPGQRVRLRRAGGQDAGDGGGPGLRRRAGLSSVGFVDGETQLQAERAPS